MANSRVCDNVLDMNEKQDDVDERTVYEENDNDDISYNRSVTFNKYCCVRTVLATMVVTTGIVVVVIVASNWRKDENVVKTIATTTKSVYWLPDRAHKQLVFEHQFLLKDLSNTHPLQILAMDDSRQIYVIMLYEMNRYFNLYMKVDFQENTETILLVSKSENIFGTNVEENTVLFCESKSFDMKFQGSSATVPDVKLSSRFEVTSNHTHFPYTINYIGGPLTLEQFISTVVNSSCEDLAKTDVLKWNITDESLACGERVYTETSPESCARDLCQTFPGIHQSKGQICRNFRSCNYLQRSCDPYYNINPSRMAKHPYCVCRKTAAENAKTLSCPRVIDDGGECEIPRRDLLVTQRNLPCLCLYKSYVVYPYMIKSEGSVNRRQDMLRWYMKEVIATGPAVTFLQCPC